MTIEINETIKRASSAINEADALLISAGAGIGVDSGLPDFRGNEGFWKAYPPIARLGISFSQMANPEWFRRDPELAWAFYGHRLELYRKTVPHDGFHYLLEAAEEKPGGYFVFTSNVDGQFQKAGFKDEYIDECPGRLACDPLKSFNLTWSVGYAQRRTAHIQMFVRTETEVNRCCHSGKLIDKGSRRRFSGTMIA